MNITNTTLRDLPLPPDCLLEKDITGSTGVNDPIENCNIFKVDGTSFARLYSNVDYELRDQVAKVQRGAYEWNNLRSIMHKNKKQYYACIGGMLYETERIGNSYGTSLSLVQVILHRMEELISGTVSGSLPVSFGNVIRNSNAVPSKLLSFGGLSPFTEKHRAVASRKRMNGIGYAGTPFYVFLAGLIAVQDQVGANQTLVKLTFNPHDKVIRLKDRLVIDKNYPIEQSLLQKKDVYLHINTNLLIMNRQVPEQYTAFSFLYENADGQMISTSSVLLKDDGQVMYGMGDSSNMRILGHGSPHSFEIMYLMLSLLLSNGTMWGASVGYGVDSFPRNSKLVKVPANGTLSSFMGHSFYRAVPVPHKEIEHKMSSLYDCYTTSVISTGSVIAIPKGTSVELGYFFLTKVKGNYKALMVGEKVSESTKLNDLASGKSILSVEKKLLTLISGKKLVVVIDQPYFPLYSSFHRCPNIGVGNIEDITQMCSTSTGIDMATSPGAMMIFQRRLREFRRQTGSSGDTSKQIISSMYDTKISSNYFTIPRLLPLTSVDNFIKYGLSIGDKSDFLEIRETMGHYPFFYKYFSYGASKDELVFQPKVSNTKSITVAFQRSIPIDDSSLIHVAIKHAINDVPADFSGYVLPAVAAKIYESDIGDKFLTNLTSKTKTSETTISIEGQLDEKKSNWG